MLLKYLAYGFVLAVYGAFAWTGKASVDAYIAVLGGVVSALGATHAISSATRAADSGSATNAANTLPPTVPTAAPTTITQAGFANPHMLVTLLLLATLAVVALSLTGCANVTQAASAYNTSGMIAARAAEDLNVKLWTENACATPLSTIVRHPEIAGGLKALCLSASTTSANELLNQLPPSTTAATGTVPAPSASVPK